MERRINLKYQPKNGRVKKPRKVKLISKPQVHRSRYNETESLLDDKSKEGHFLQCVLETAIRRTLGFEMIIQKYENIDEGDVINLRTMTVELNKGVLEGCKTPKLFGSFTTYSVSQNTMTLLSSMNNKSAFNVKNKNSERKIDPSGDNQTELKLNDSQEALEQLKIQSGICSKHSIICEKTDLTQKSPTQGKLKDCFVRLNKLELEKSVTDSKSSMAIYKPEICNMRSVINQSKRFWVLRLLLREKRINISDIDTFVNQNLKDLNDLHNGITVKPFEQINFYLKSNFLNLHFDKPTQTFPDRIKKADKELALPEVENNKNSFLNQIMNDSKNASTSSCITPVRKSCRLNRKTGEICILKQEKSSTDENIALSKSSLYINYNTYFSEDELEPQINKMGMLSLKLPEKYIDAKIESLRNFKQPIKRSKKSSKGGSNRYQDKSDICAPAYKKRKLEESHINELLKNRTESPVNSKWADDLHFANGATNVSKANMYQLKSNTSTTFYEKLKLEEGHRNEILKIKTESPINFKPCDLPFKKSLKDIKKGSECLTKSNTSPYEKEKLERTPKHKCVETGAGSSDNFKLDSSHYFKESPKNIKKTNHDQIKSRICASPYGKMKPKHCHWSELTITRTESPTDVELPSNQNFEDLKIINKDDCYPTKSNTSAFPVKWRQMSPMNKPVYISHESNFSPMSRISSPIYHSLKNDCYLDETTVMKELEVCPLKIVSKYQTPDHMTLRSSNMSNSCSKSRICRNNSNSSCKKELFEL